MKPKRNLREAAPPVPPEDDPLQGAAGLLDEPPVEDDAMGPGPETDAGPAPGPEEAPMEPGPEAGAEEFEPTDGPDSPEVAEPPPAEGGRKTAITGKYNSSPVGDIKMQKAKGTYNTYKLELSMGQLEVIMNALEANHTDPVSDELLATFQYYLKEMPGPGEDEDKFEAEKKKAKANREAGLAPGGEGGETPETPIPMPPGGNAGTPPAGAEEEATFMPDEEEGEPPGINEPTAGAPEPGLPEPEGPPAGEPPGKSRMMATARGESPADIDTALPKPPRE